MFRAYYHEIGSMALTVLTYTHDDRHFSGISQIEKYGQSITGDQLVMKTVLIRGVLRTLCNYSLHGSLTNSIHILLQVALRSTSLLPPQRLHPASSLMRALRGCVLSSPLALPTSGGCLTAPSGSGGGVAPAARRRTGQGR